MTINITSVYCSQAVDGGGGGSVSFLDKILGKGNSFFTPGGAEGSDTLGANIAQYLSQTFVPMIGDIGNLIFFVIAAILGVKYIWSGVEGKSQVKETLPTFVVGASLFFLSQKIYTFATVTLTQLTAGTTFTVVQSSIWATVALVVNVLAIAGIVALGLKYMFTSASTKAEIKKDLVPVFIGLILIYATSNILTFIVNVGGQML